MKEDEVYQFDVQPFLNCFYSFNFWRGSFLYLSVLFCALRLFPYSLDRIKNEDPRCQSWESLALIVGIRGHLELWSRELAFRLWLQGWEWALGAAFRGQGNEWSDWETQESNWVWCSFTQWGSQVSWWANAFAGPWCVRLWLRRGRQRWHQIHSAFARTFFVLSVLELGSHVLLDLKEPPAQEFINI